MYDDRSYFDGARLCGRRAVVLGRFVVALSLEAYKGLLDLVIRRREWLTAVLEGKPEDLEDLGARLLQESEVASTDAASRDQGSVARAGPCVGYQDLKCFSILEEHGPQFRTVTSQAEVKALNAEVQPAKKLFGVLSTSCRAAVLELRAQRTRDQETVDAKKKEHAKQAKDAADRKKGVEAGGRGPAAKKLRMQHIALDMDWPADVSESVQIPSATSWPSWEEQAIQSPFLVTQCKLDGEEVKNKITDFKKSFIDSAVRTTDGRGHVWFSEEDGPVLYKTILDFIKSTTKSCSCGTVFWSQQDVGQAFDSAPAVGKHLSPSTFGICTGHEGPPRSELFGMGCFRMHMAGTRQVALFSVAAVRLFLAKGGQPTSITIAQARAWAETVDKESLVKFKKAYLSVSSPPLWVQATCCSFLHSGCARTV